MPVVGAAIAGTPAVELHRSTMSMLHEVHSELSQINESPGSPPSPCREPETPNRSNTENCFPNATLTNDVI